MSEARQRAFATLDRTDMTVTLVTPDSLSRYLLPEHPLHEGYPFLSETHRADYLRCYFMHWYGGGYSDIKHTSSSWLPSYDNLMGDANAWAAGYIELQGGSVHPGQPELDVHYRLLIGGNAP